MAKTETKPRRLRIALIGGESLLGRELRDVLEAAANHVDTTTYSASGEGNFTDHDGEAVYLQALTAQTVQGADAIVLAGSPEGAARAYELVKAAHGVPTIVDCVGDLEQKPEARVIAAPHLAAHQQNSWLQIVAHPAAAALASLLAGSGRCAAIRQTIAHVFEPASERGKKGVSELHQQTTSLLAFKGLEKKVFDAQVTFNLLSQYGEEAPGKLASAEQRIERHLASILGNTAGTPLPMPSLRLVQAPVFHGYSISLWVEFEQNVSATQVAEALASTHIEVRGEQDEAPNVVGVAGQSGLIAGDIRVDRNNPRAVWIWAVGDNLRLTADAAAAILATLKTVSK